MTRTRASATLAFATTFVGASVLSGIVAMPLAHADPLDAIRGAVNGNRQSTACPAYTYSGALEGAAQAYARSENPVDGQPGGYNGRTLAFLGSGDPQADAINSAYKRGAGGLISNCDFTEFGVGFVRHEDRSVDVVTIVFGAPPKAPKPADIPMPPPQAQTTPCEGSDPVPVGTPCPVKKDPLPSPDSITMDVVSSGFGKVDVKFTNSSAVAATCDYVATPNGVGPTVNRTVQVKANGTGVIGGLTDPRPLLSYHLAATCTGTVNGEKVPLGNPQTDI